MLLPSNAPAWHGRWSRPLGRRPSSTSTSQLSRPRRWPSGRVGTREVLHISGFPSQDRVLLQHSLRISGLLRQHAAWNVYDLLEGIATLAFQEEQEVTKRIGEQPIFVEACGVLRCSRGRLFWPQGLLTH